MEYRNLDVTFIGKKDDGEGWRVKLDMAGERQQSSPDGGSQHEISLSLDTTLEDVVELAARLGEYQARQGEANAARNRLEQAILSVGQGLSEGLNSGSLGGEFKRHLREVRSQFEKGLRIRLRWDPREDKLNRLGGLPWELMVSERARFGLTRDLSISRFLAAEYPVPPCPAQEIRVLMVASEPHGSHPIYAADEMRALRRGVQHRHRVYVSTERAVICKVRERLIDGRFHVLHFMGHGDFDPEHGVAQILLENEDGSKNWLAPWEFAEQLAQLDHLRLVVLTSCWGTRMPQKAGHNVYHALAPALLSRGIPAVIGMQFPITHHAAADFSRRFYACLADRGMPVDAAATEARLCLAGEGNLEWILPTTFVQTEDGIILDMKDVDERERLKIGIRNFANGHGNGMEVESDRFLPLESFFEADERTIKSKDPLNWNQMLLPEMETFLSQLYGDRRVLQFNFATLWSITFATGHFLEAKSGLEIEIFQRGSEGGGYLRPERSKIAEYKSDGGGLWEIETVDGKEEASDVVLAISVTWDILDQVEGFWEESGNPEFKRLIHARIAGGVGQDSVKDGSHSFCLAQQLALEISRRLSIEEKRATLHIFCSAPNIFAFHLGQLSRNLADVQLYEHGFPTVSDYRSSFRFQAKPD